MQRNENCRVNANESMLQVICAAIKNTPIRITDRGVFEEMKAHKIEALVAPILLPQLVQEDLYKEWKHQILIQIGLWHRYCSVQNALPIKVPYVILKGTSAAKYYPHPEYRCMGDIDIMTRHEDYNTACEMLIQNGFAEQIDSSDLLKAERHRSFIGNGIEIEVHNFYGLRNRVEETQLIDQLIMDNMDPSHVLPDLINGITLIEHVNHHLEEGIGLRQILDWRMFVEKCLSDGQWPAFQAIAKDTGHEQLAIVVTRMCEMYLGLPEHHWCAGADMQTCKELMEYVLACGNFGRKKTLEQQTSERTLSHARSIRSFFRYLTYHGLLNTKTSPKGLLSRSFARIYQLNRYLIKGLFRPGSIRKLKEEVSEAQRKEKLFKAMGVSRGREGRVIYKDKKYQVGKY